MIPIARIPIAIRHQIQRSGRMMISARRRLALSLPWATTAKDELGAQSAYLIGLIQPTESANSLDAGRPGELGRLGEPLRNSLAADMTGGENRATCGDSNLCSIW